MRLPFPLFRCFCLILAGATAVAASARAQAAALTLSYAGKTVSISAKDFAALPHQEVTAFDAHDKKTHTYSGVPARDLLTRVGVAFGEKLRGRFLQLAVLARSKDGYGVAFALAEFDPAFRSTTILVVDQQDGAALGAGAGPFRLLAPGDQRPARWARMVTSLEVVGVGDAK